MEIKAKNIFKVVFSCLFIIYITLFFASKTGYYDYKNKERKELTEIQIKKFEEDIKNGVEIDLNEYILTTNNNYQNNLSIFGKNFSNIISSCVSKSVNKSFNYIEKFVVQN